jgi:hypothetical protein
MGTGGVEGNETSVAHTLAVLRFIDLRGDDKQVRSAGFVRTGATLLSD